MATYATRGLFNTVINRSMEFYYTSLYSQQCAASKKEKENKEKKRKKKL